MAELTLTTFVTLDGVMQAPGGPKEDTTGGFRHGGWTVPYWDADFGRLVDERFRPVTGFLLGRRTYEIFAGYWPHQKDPDNVVAARLNGCPKWVVSTTLTPEQADWPGTTVISSDVPDAVAGLKADVAGEIQIHGSGRLAQSLMAEGLIDEYRLYVFPVVIGDGRRLFAEGAVPTGFQLVGTETTSKDVVLHTYRPAGPAAFGSY
ncbi:dihydrofolate reductase family protein [Streptomyces sp. NPDC101118]|uniref:dihydrofolate reductase family protein n=1 Tax=Streptomyces sp. NPDC101118 TaxID=3366109 RepID=UPI0038281101